MNILVTYIRKNLMMNKSSTFLSIISLITASALFFIVTCLCVNTFIGFNESLVHTYGNYQAVFHHVDDDFVRSMELHGQIEQVYTVENGKKFNVDCFISTGKDSFHLAGMNETVFDDLGLVLIEGTYPTHSNEILVSDKALYDSKISLDLNETIILDDKEYTITGIMEDTFMDYESSSYTLVTIEEPLSSRDVYLRFYDQNNSKAICEQIASSFAGQYESYELNKKYLLFHIDDHNQLNTVLGVFIVVLLAGFLAMNILLIRNSYKNSYANREKHLAILKTVGVTQSQCITMILYEGLLLLFISLLIGIPAGWILYDLFISFLNSLIHSVFNLSFTLGHHYQEMILFISIIYVSSLTLYFIFKSSKKIVTQNVSLTLQSSDEVQVMDHPYLELEKNQNIVRRLFRKNIRQNHRSYRHLIIEVIAVLTLFILMNTFMGYFREGGFIDLNEHNYDVEVVIHNEFYPTSLMSQLKNRKGAENVVISEIIQLETSDLSGLDDNYYEHTFIGDSLKFEVIAFSNEILESFSARTGVDFNLLMDVERPCGILINQMYASAHRRFFDIMKKNELKDLNYQDQRIFSSFSLLETDTLLTGTSYQKNPQIIISRELMNMIVEKSNLKMHEYHVFFQTNDSSSLVRELYILNNSHVSDYEVINIQEALKNGRVMINLIRILSYGYILCLIIMGILATSCVASVNFDYRRKEFLLFRIMGLRMREMIGLIFMEMFFYCSLILTSSWIISQLLNIICYKVYFQNIGLTFYFPINSLIGSILLFVILIIIFMIYIYFRMKTQKYSAILKNEISMM